MTFRLHDRAAAAAELPYWKTDDSELSETFTFGASRKLAYSAQMYHYEQQKRRIIEEERSVANCMHARRRQ